MMTVHDVFLRGRARPRLAGVSLTLEDGHVYGLVGPNGAGKSSLLEVLAGVALPQRGEVRGAPWQRLEPTGAVFGDSALHPGRTVLETLSLRAKLVRVPSSVARSVADEVGLGSVLGRRVRALSLGMKMRLSIGVALLGDPPLMLLDEPMNGLDPEGIAWMRALVADRRQAGVTIVISSHLLSELESMSDSVIVVSAGTISGTTAVEELRSEAAELVVSDVALFLSALQRAGIEASSSARSVGVRSTVAAAVRVAIDCGVDVLEACAPRHALEDLYLATSVAEHTRRSP